MVYSGRMKHNGHTLKQQSSVLDKKEKLLHREDSATEEQIAQRVRVVSILKGFLDLTG